MEFKRFIERIKTIKMLKDKVSHVNGCLTLAFSDDVKYNKIYADGFNFIEDKMVEDLVNDLSIESQNSKEIIEDILEYFIYEINFSKDKRKFTYIKTDSQPEEKSFDCTVWNIFQDLKNTLYNSDDFDTFENPKYKFED